MRRIVLLVGLTVLFALSTPMALARPGIGVAAPAPTRSGIGVPFPTPRLTPPATDTQP